MKVAVFGLGYVGSVTAACLAEAGHEVIGVDPDQRKVDSIESGDSPIAEPGLDELIALQREAGRLRATTDASVGMAQAEVSLVSVGTPSQLNGSLDLTHVRTVIGDIGACLADRDRSHTVVVRSTVLPGSVDEVVVPLLEQSSGRPVGEELGVAFWPEFLRESTAIADFREPPFSVIGTRGERSRSALTELAGSAGELVLTNVPVAESLKYACNAFHAVKVSFANEISRVLSATDADPREVMEVFCKDDQLNISPAYLRPGFAFGGSCLPKDLRAIAYHAKMNDVEVPLLRAALDSNEQHLRLAHRIIMTSGARRVALLGLSFKDNTDDLRESPYVALAEMLIGRGIELRIFDEFVHPSRLFGTNKAFVEERLPHLGRLLAHTPAGALDGAEVAVVATAGSEVVSALLHADPETVLDLHGRLPEAVAAMKGYTGLAW
jgi:GDP-mannose 6-dehydrogenase